jgi:hypothetical protein
LHFRFSNRDVAALRRVCDDEAFVRRCHQVATWYALQLVGQRPMTTARVWARDRKVLGGAVDTLDQIRLREGNGIPKIEQQHINVAAACIRYVIDHLPTKGTTGAPPKQQRRVAIRKLAAVFRRADLRPTISRTGTPFLSTVAIVLSVAEDGIPDTEHLADFARDALSATGKAGKK